jgi:uncharacterized protein YegP (UPF0339 family)
MFNLKAGNHEVMLTSQRFATRSRAENCTASPKKNAASTICYQRAVAKDNAPYFVLEIIGKGELGSVIGFIVRVIARN